MSSFDQRREWEMGLKLRREEMIGDETAHYEAVEMLRSGWSDAV